MKEVPGGEQRMFEAFLKSTQYLLRLQSQQDIWEHLGRFVLTHFPANWLSFVERDSDNDLAFRYSTLPKGVSTEQILTSEVRVLLSDVLDSGFLATRVLLLPAPSMTVFLPIVENGRASRVMMIGHLDAQPLPSELLGIYLALAGLAGTTTERKRAEEEVRRLNAELERRVEERTMQFQRANEELQRESIEHKRTEEALQEGRVILDAALASMTDAVFISDATGQFINFNDAFVSFHKFRNKAECAKKLSDYPDFLDVFTADGQLAPLEMWAVPRALRGETITNAEYRLRRKDTGETWVGSYSFSPIRDNRATIVGSVVVGRDITESKRAEEALRESEERLRSMGDNLPESYVYQYTYEEDGSPRFLYLSAGVEKLHGVKASDVLRDASVLHRQIEQEQLAAMEAAEAASLQILTDFQMELRMCRSDGQWRWFHLRSRPRRKPDGQFLWDGVATDITERKRVQEQLRESEVLYRSLFDSMVEAFCIVEVIFDPEGKGADFRFLEVNPAFEKQTGLHAAVGKRMSELVPDNEAYWAEIYGMIALTGEAAHFENEAKALNRYYEVRAYRVGEPELRQVAIVFNDISGRKRAEEVLRSALEEKTALLKEVHHRVKNNLQIVSSLLNLQVRGVKNDVALETLRDTQGRIRAMALLHETLYRESNAGRVNCSIYFSHLCAHLCRAFGPMGERVRVRTEIATVELGIDVAIPCGLIINELVSNSFKHAFPDGRRGEIMVRLHIEAEGRIVLSVGDDGIGLPPGADYQQNSTLGAKLVTGLAKQIAGTLEVKSDHGTMVQVNFIDPEKGRQLS